MCEFESYIKEKELEEKGHHTEIKSEEQLKEEWEQKLKEREERIAEEEEQREKKIQKAKRMEQSYELLRLCR